MQAGDVGGRKLYHSILGGNRLSWGVPLRKTPGEAFFADGGGRQNMRLSFCYPTPDAIRLGIRRLATVISGERELLETFAGTGRLTPAQSGDSVTAPPPDMS